MCGTPGNEGRGCLWCFDWLLGTIPHAELSCPNRNTGRGAWPYDSVMCHALLMLMGGLSLSKQLWRRGGLRLAQKGVAERKWEERREGRLRSECKINKLINNKKEMLGSFLQRKGNSIYN